MRGGSGVAYYPVITRLEVVAVASEAWGAVTLPAKHWRGVSTSQFAARGTGVLVRLLPWRVSATWSKVLQGNWLLLVGLVGRA